MRSTNSSKSWAASSNAIIVTAASRRGRWSCRGTASPWPDSWPWPNQNPRQNTFSSPLLRSRRLPRTTLKKLHVALHGGPHPCRGQSRTGLPGHWHLWKNDIESKRCADPPRRAVEIWIQGREIPRENRFRGRAAKDPVESMAPQEYGFYANVNPEVDHPRWSQKTSASLAAFFLRQTANTQVQRLRKRNRRALRRDGSPPELLTYPDTWDEPAGQNSCQNSSRSPNCRGWPPVFRRPWHLPAGSARIRRKNCCIGPAKSPSGCSAPSWR